MPIMQIGSLHLLVNRKAIKNLHISVLPPDGKVRVSAPEHMTETAIRMAVASQLSLDQKTAAGFRQTASSIREGNGQRRVPLSLGPKISPTCD